MDAWWGNMTYDGDYSRVLVMKEDRPAREMWHENELVQSGCTQLRHRIFFLGLLHMCGRVHRDVRAPNIMLFGDIFQLIDYGFSCDKGPTDEPLLDFSG